MFGKKRWMALVLILAFVMSLSYPALAADKRITRVSLRITSNIEAGSDSDDVKVTTNSTTYEVKDYYVTNEPSSGEWKKGNRPKLEITLEAKSEYYFATSRSGISLSGTEATVSSVKKYDGDDGQLVINVTLAAIDNGSGGYDLDIYGAQWDEDQGYGYWEGGEEARKFEVKVYRGSSLLNSSTLTTTETSYDLSSYITRSGTYTFRVRGVYNSSYKGSWQESESWYVDSQTAREFREYYENGGSSNTPSGSGSSSGPSNSSSNSAAGPNRANSTGAWLKDNVGWWYCNADRSYTVNNWQYIDNKWYFFNERGYMVTGWVLWKNLYYYCGSSGDMLTNTWTPDGYYVDGNGVWVQGMRR